MKKHYVDVMISEQDVRARISELGREITQYYHQQKVEKLIVVGLLRGSFMFMADLVREIDLPVKWNL
ncbi:Hypoxanthine-guanine phosphoribosyltransferase [Avibacterium endocarditidis]